MSTTFPACTNAGLLDRRIALETFTETMNEYGELIPEWRPLMEVWAQRRVLTGREVFESGQEQAVVDTRFRIRAIRGGLDPGMRVRDGLWLYDVLSVTPDGREEMLELACRARDDKAPVPHGKRR